MSTSIGLSFIKNFEAEVYAQYQQMGSKLRNTVRTKNGVVGATTTFQKVGKGTASTVKCRLQDVYASDWINDLDELKTNSNEQRAEARAGACAIGRKSDELIIAELVRSTSFAGLDTDGLTKAKILTAFELLGEANVPDDGQRYAVVGWKQWIELLKIEEFANADYIGDDELPWKGTAAKRWLGTLWLPHSGLPKSGSVRSCFWYHKTAIGHAIGCGVKTSIIWRHDRAAYFVNNRMRQGACLIDPNGVVALRCIES